EYPAKDAPLKIVGILEFINQPDPEPFAQGCCQPGAQRPLERRPQPARHIVEVDEPALALESLEPLGDRRQKIIEDARFQRYGEADPPNRGKKAPGVGRQTGCSVQRGDPLERRGIEPAAAAQAILIRLLHLLGERIEVRQRSTSRSLRSQFAY